MTAVELALVVPEGEPNAIASDLRHSDLGRAVFINDGVASYLGYIRSIIFHQSGEVAIRLSRGAAEASTTLSPIAPLMLLDAWRE